MKKTITKNEYDSLTRDGKVLERDNKGIKVIQLPQQRIIKLFRRKRLLSSQIWINYASRFKRNAHRLRSRGIPTVEVEVVYNIPEIERSAVLYKMLEGVALRQLLAQATTAEQVEIFKKFGEFVATLHQRGILFRSFHFDNVLVLPDRSFGLIDIVDTGFWYFGSLYQQQRIRNFHHMDRHDEDRRYMADNCGNLFIASYLATADLSKKRDLHLKEAFNEIFARYGEP